MATLTIRNVDDDVKKRLRLQAAERGHSMEEEVREILRRGVSGASKRLDLAKTIRARIDGLDDHELEIPPRQEVRRPPAFDDADR